MIQHCSFGQFLVLFIFIKNHSIRKIVFNHTVLYIQCTTCFRQDVDFRPKRHIEYKISPSPPVIGTTRLPEIFEFNKSLHYLIPEVIKYKVSLDECDYVILKRAIIDADPQLFLRLLDKYQNLVTFENFIINIVISLRNDLKSANATIKNLFSCLGKYSTLCSFVFLRGKIGVKFTTLYSSGFDKLDTHTKKLVKVVFEVAVMNLLVEFDKSFEGNDAVELLEQFSDWDGLASSQVYDFFIEIF